jgi:ABC-type sugar transport systems, permease components
MTRSHSGIAIGLLIGLLAAMFCAPILGELAESLFSDGDLGAARSLVGVQNYVDIATDVSIGQAVIASIVFTLGAVFIQLALALGGALFAPDRSWLVRTLLLLPYSLPSVVLVLVWRFLADPAVGAIPHLIALTGLRPIDSLGPGASLCGAVLISGYEAFPFCYVLLLVRLLQIPKDNREVAEICGAQGATIWRSLYWPAIRRMVLFLGLLRTIVTVSKFDIPWLVFANRARHPWTDTLGVKIYRTAFEELKFGRASAIGIAALVVACGIWLLWHRFRKVERVVA